MEQEPLRILRGPQVPMPPATEPRPTSRPRPLCEPTPPPSPHLFRVLCLPLVPVLGRRHSDPFALLGSTLTQ
jgi:hypothetical protein